MANISLMCDPVYWGVTVSKDNGEESYPGPLA